MKPDILRMVVRGALDFLLHDNADMIDILNEHNRPDLIGTINLMETALTWLRKQLDTAAENENA